MSLHTHTPQLLVIDPRMLRVREVAYCRSDPDTPAQERVSRRTWDVAGRAVADWDPRLWAAASRANTTVVRSLSGRTLLADSVDAGWTLSLTGADRHVQESWDGRGHFSVIESDEQLRPVSVTEKTMDADAAVVERLTYGDASAPSNQCGRLIRHDDPGGAWQALAFGLVGGVLIENRRFLQDTQLSPDWPLESASRDQLLEAGEGHTTTTLFDATAMPVSRIDATGNRQVHRYNVDGSLKETGFQGAGRTKDQILVSDIHYNPFGQVVSEQLGNGVVTQNTYELETGRLVSLKAQLANGNVLQHLTYQYDPVGNIVRTDDLVPSSARNAKASPVNLYDYDSLYQLIAATGREVKTGFSHGPALPDQQVLPDPNQLADYTQTYTYDAGGNLRQMRHLGDHLFTRTMLVASDSNRSLPEGELDADLENGFDANGNLQELVRGQTLMWNLRNQLRQVTAVQRPGGTNDDEVYVYDGGGQRCRKIRSAQTSGRTLVSEVRYLPGLEIRSEPDGELLYIASVQAGRSSVRILHWEAGKPDAIDNDQLRYTLEDHLGSSALELDHQGGLISQEGYYPFGGTAWWAARSAVEAKYKTIRYSGKERDASGLYYYGFRYYAPWLMRWINPDPERYVDGLNVYRAMRNSPVVYRDPDGRMPQTTDTTYSKRADDQKIHPVQAVGMTPVRRFWIRREEETGLHSAAIDYREGIPKAIDDLAAMGRTDWTITADAHTVAAARTGTSQPSGAVMYHGGELISAGLNTVFGEAAATAVVGPLSEVFNDPMASQETLNRNRKLASSTVRLASELMLHAAAPPVKFLGAIGKSAANAMDITEAGTAALYSGLRRGSADSFKRNSVDSSSDLIPSYESLVSVPRIIQQLENIGVQPSESRRGSIPVNLDAVRQAFLENVNKDNQRAYSPIREESRPGSRMSRFSRSRSNSGSRPSSAMSLD